MAVPAYDDGFHMDAMGAIVNIARGAYDDMTADGAMTADEWFIGFGLDADGLFRDAMMEYIRDSNDGDESIWNDLGIDRCGIPIADMRSAVADALGMSGWYLMGEVVMKDGDAESPPDDE